MSDPPSEVSAMQDMFAHKSGVARNTMHTRNESTGNNERPYRLATWTCYLLMAVGALAVWLLMHSRTNSIGAVNMMVITLSLILIGGAYVVTRALNEYNLNMMNERMDEMQSCRNRIDQWISGMRETQSRDVAQIAQGIGGMAKTIATTNA